MTRSGGWLYRVSPLQRCLTLFNLQFLRKSMSPNLTKCFQGSQTSCYYCDEKFIVVANSNNTGSDSQFKCPIN